MTTRSLILALLLAGSPGPGGDPPAAPGSGVIVEDLFTGSAGHEAGLRVGDRIHGWSRPEGSGVAGGRIDSELDLLDAATEQGPRGPVHLHGERQGEPRSWLLPTRRWGLTVRPELPAPLLLLYREGLEALAAGQAEAAAAKWRQAAAVTDEPRLSIWLLGRLATRLRLAGRWDLAEPAYREATERAEAANLVPLAAHCHREWARDLLRFSEWRPAGEHLRRALFFDQRRGAPNLSRASTLFTLAFATSLGGDLESAVGLARESLALRERLAPESYVVALSLGNLGALENRRANFAAARALLDRATALHRRVAPPGPDLAGTLVNLGHVEDALGAPEAARAAFAEALSILDQTSPRGDTKARALAGLALLDLARGDLAEAEAGLEAALEIWDQVGGEPVNRAKALGALAEIARKRGHLPLAESYLEQAFEMRQRLTPSSPELAVDLANLGVVALDRKDFAKARSAFERALAMQRRLAASSPLVGSLLVSLGKVSLLSGEPLEQAEASTRAGLVDLEATAAESLLHAGALLSLARVRQRQGGAAEAEALLSQAQTLVERLAPDSSALAEVLHLRGRLAGGSAAAPALLCAAADAVDRQRQRLGGSAETRSTFELATERIYFACAEARLRQGEPALAFAVLERSRARSFLTLLDQRQLSQAEIPAELAAKRRELEAADDRLQAELAGARASGQEVEIERLERALRDVRRRRERLVARTPGPPAESARRPLGLEAARAQLDAGTLLLSYFVGEESSLLFVVEPGVEVRPGEDEPGFAAHLLPLGREALGRQVKAFLESAGRRPAGPSPSTDLDEALYRQLLAPAAAAMARSERLLISPDGPLHALPFGALRRGERLLVEEQPLHFALSATVYAELRTQRGSASKPEIELVAFGDPFYGPSSRGEERAASKRLALPASRDEVLGIGALFESRRLFLGAEASEENAKAMSGKARLLHFACHGLLDPLSPLDSGLALSPSSRPGSENGLLQAWEIFESLELSADLVTLSACETALGTEMGGEGLIGLTRALHYAGARSVVASLWNISDRSTAQLMKVFYGHLARGKSKDEALRLAQLELLRESDGTLAHPYHWAAFQLYGDYR